MQSGGAGSAGTRSTLAIGGAWSITSSHRAYFLRPPKKCGKIGQLSLQVNIPIYVTPQQPENARKWRGHTCGIPFELLILHSRQAGSVVHQAVHLVCNHGKIVAAYRYGLFTTMIGSAFLLTR